MSTENAIVSYDPEIVSKLVLQGDISTMSSPQKVQYYNAFCKSLGLNPLTQPFAIIKFQGKERLYAQKDCTEQLRKIHGVSITDVQATELKGVYVVTAKAIDKTGKTDAATGVVPLDNLKGADLANALMKAETKAKRRVTLSICGLGMLDENEPDTMKDAFVSPMPTGEDKVSSNEFKIKYTDANGVEKALANVLNIDDISSLYYENAEIVEATPALKSKFTESKNGLKALGSLSFTEFKELFEQKKNSLTGEDLEAAERVITNREYNSFGKLLKLLQNK